MNSLGSNKEVVESKLILLYIFDKFDIPVSNQQITKFILEIRFMNYFLLQQFLNELNETKFLTSDTTEGKVLYKITRAGRQTLEYLSTHIPAGIKARIDNTFSAMRMNIRNETLVTADFIPESENKFIVTCKASEDSFPLIELNVTVGTKSDARNVCDNWKNHSEAIYSEIIDILIKKRE